MYTPFNLTHLHGKIDTPFRQVTHSYKTVYPLPKFHRHSLLTLEYSGDTSQLRENSPECSLIGNGIFMGRGSFPLIQCIPLYTKLNNASVNFCQLTSEVCLSPARCVYLGGEMCLNDRASVSDDAEYTGVDPGYVSQSVNRQTAQG